MKATFKYMIAGYTGTCDGLVYYYNRMLGRVVARRWRKPRLSNCSKGFGRISTNLKRLAVSEGFKADLSIYVQVFNGRSANSPRCLPNWYNAFTRMMWNLAEIHPGISLETITRAEIYASDLPCRSVKRAVEAGLLDGIDGYGLLVREM